MSNFSTKQKGLLALSTVLFLISCLSSVFRWDSVYRIISLAAIVSIICMGVVSLEGVTRYRPPLLWVLGGMGVFLLGDAVSLFVDAPIVSGFAENMHTLAGLFFAIAISVYVSIDFSRRELNRILMDVFLLFVLVGVTLHTTIGNIVRQYSGEHVSIGWEGIISFIPPIFIVAILIMIVSLRAPFAHPWSSYLLLVALLVYTGAGFQHGFNHAVRMLPAVEHIGLWYLFSFYLMGISFLNRDLQMTSSITTGEFNSRLSLILGWVFALVAIGVSSVFYLVGLIDSRGYVPILVASLAYIVMWKTQQAFELEQELRMLTEQQSQAKEKELVSTKEEKAVLSRQLEESALTDSLTGLHNRNYIAVYLEQSMEEDYEKSITFFSVDINYFRSVNDTYGYGTGDLALMEVANRLSLFTEYENTCFRTGGDEFLLALRGIKEYSRIDQLAADLAEILDMPVEIHGNQFHLIANIGIASYPWDTKNVYEVINFAELARASIKHTTGKTSFSHYDVQIAPKVNRMHQIERRLQEVDFEEGFSMYYQPQVMAKTGELIGMEALIRWNDEKLGFVSPAEFIPMAEEMGIMGSLGNWINRQTITQIKKWNETYQKDYVCGINASPVQMRDPAFASKFIALQRGMGVKTNWIDIELTEGIATNSTFYNNENLRQLREGGHTFSIDDFGTGYASFANMIRFDYDRLKIAKELVDDIATDHNARVVVEAIILMAKGMHMHTIAEGVETKEQLDILIELGCEQIQGYYFGRPLPMEEFEATWLK